MKKIIGDNIRYWYLVVTVLIVTEICNQKLFVTMIDPMHSMVLSCAIICALFIYLGCVLSSATETYFSDKRVSDEALLQRIEILENTIVSLDEKNKELENQLVAQTIENANNLYGMTIENMNSAFSINKNYMENQFAELEVQYHNDNENLKDVVYEQNKVIQDICANIDDNLKEQCDAINNAVVEKTNDVVNKLVEQVKYSRANQEVLVAGLANVEAKQAEGIANAVERINAVNAENHKAVLETIEVAGNVAKANKEAIVSELLNAEVKQAEGIANAVEQINAMNAENHSVVLATIETATNVARANKEAIVSELLNAEAKQAEGIANAVEQINAVNAENHKVVLETMETASNVVKAIKEAIVAELANIEFKQAEGIASAVDQINAVNAENHKVVLETMETVSTVAKVNKEAIVTELANVEAKQAKGIANAVEQINIVNAENHNAVLATMETASNVAKANKEAIVAELVNVEAKQAEGIAKAVEQINSVNAENYKVVLETIEVASNVAKANKEAIVAELANVEAKQAEGIANAVEQMRQSQTQVTVLENAIKQLEDANIVNNKLLENAKQIIDGDRSKNNYAENLLAIEKIAKENKAALASGFNNLAQKQKTTFDNMHKQFDMLEALVNNSRVDLYNRFELLKKEQKDTFANVLEQIDQMKSATQDTIANEIAKLSIIEDILADEFEEDVEQPKYDASKPEIEVGNKYQVKTKEPNRVEMIVDDKLGTTLKNAYKNNKLSSSQIISNGKVTYEVVYDANERPAKSKSYDANGNVSIELEYYENGQVKKRIQNVMQNGIKMKQTTNFDINGNKI